MRNLLLGGLVWVIAATGLGFGQVSVQTQPKVVKEWTRILQDAGDGKTFTDSTYTTDVDLSNLRGAATLFIIPDISVTSTISGDMTIEIEVYNEQIGVWAVWYGSDKTMFTVPAARVNDDDQAFYIDLSESDPWAWADRVRFKLKLPTGEDANLEVWVGGQ